MELAPVISDEQMGIIHDLLVKSPPGELYVVLDELKDLLGEVQIPSGPLRDALKEYNLTNNVLVDVPNQKDPLLLVGSLDDDSDVYQDVLREKCYRFDHLSNSVSEELTYEGVSGINEQMSQLKVSLVGECKKYVDRRFSSRSSGFVGSDGDHIDIIIVGEMIKLNSYYSGRWVSQYSVDVVGSSVHLTGVVTISSHYFENGNVRMEVHREMPAAEINGISAMSEVAVQVFKRIALFEDELQEGLKSVFSSLKQDALKTFRRQLPRTRQHFQWNVNAHRMADTMKEMNK